MKRQKIHDRRCHLHRLRNEQEETHRLIVRKEKESAALEDQNEALNAGQIEGIMLVETVNQVQAEITELKTDILVDRIEQIKRIYEENKELREKLEQVKQRAREITGEV